MSDYRTRLRENLRDMNLGAARSELRSTGGVSDPGIILFSIELPINLCHNLVVS